MGSLGQLHVAVTQVEKIETPEWPVFLTSAGFSSNKFNENESRC